VKLEATVYTHKIPICGKCLVNEVFLAYQDVRTYKRNWEVVENVLSSDFW